MLPPYPQSLKTIVQEAITSINHLPQIPFSKLKPITELGVIPIGPAQIFYRFITIFRKQNPTTILKIIADTAIIEHPHLKNDPYVTYLSVPQSTDLETFKNFQNYIKAQNITPWITFTQTPSALNESLLVSNGFTNGLLYLFTINDILIETTQEQRLQHQLAQTQFNQLCHQYWINCPLYKVV